MFVSITGGLKPTSSDEVFLSFFSHVSLVLVTFFEHETYFLASVFPNFTSFSPVVYLLCVLLSLSLGWQGVPWTAQRGHLPPTAICAQVFLIPSLCQPIFSLLFFFRCCSQACMFTTSNRMNVLVLHSHSGVQKFK